ncbi:hypothetical protein FRC11_007432 [Ceratobasidium sp. 423]|nr:hypothetical protein FRC11_007432 [Ceratobasidium sp. 423]
MAVMSRLLPLVAYSTFAIFLLALMATPANALANEPHVRVARGHDSIAKRKRNIAKRAKRCRPQTTSLVAASATPSTSAAPSSSTPAPTTTPQASSSYAAATTSHSSSAAAAPTTTKPATTKSSSSSAAAATSTSVSVGGGSSGGSTGLDPNKKLLLAWANGPTDLEKYAYGTRVGGMYTWSPWCPDNAATLNIACYQQLWGFKQKSDFTSLINVKKSPLVFGFNDTDEFKAYVDDWYKTFGKPLIISEYACQNFSGGAQCTKDQTNTFHYTMAPWFDQHEGVAMYAPFGFMHDMGNVNYDNQLMASGGGPNALGQFYLYH